MKTYLITGSAGFIGFHVAKHFLESGSKVIGVDNFNEYYDITLKESRNAILEKYDNFTLYKGNISNVDFVKKVFSENIVDVVCHLAAQAGVRYSIKNPYTYIDSNIVGFTNVINEAKNIGVKNFVYASSSSVYGNQDTAPFSEDFVTDRPLSLYASTKKANEVIAHSYHHLFGMNCTGLRFFTVYGPWGRPDMALFSFTKAILENEAIPVFNNGDMYRDFTYIDDIVSGVVSACEKCYPFELFNLGNHTPVKLSYMIQVLEKEIGKEAKKDLLPLQPGDVVSTYADISRSKELLEWTPQTSIEEGIKKFVEWYNQYFI